MSFLKSHPFAVEAFFENSLVLTFAIPKYQLQKLIPSYLSLDTFKDEWGFLAIALVKTKQLRPKGFPKWMGNDFFLIGYRIFVQYINKKGKRLRGLYILKSETDNKRMEFFGNIFTHYSYKTTDINILETENLKTISSVQSKFEISLNNVESNFGLPQNSPFKDWKEARRFAGPLPFTFSINESNKSVLIIEGVRKNWKPQPVYVSSQNFNFLNELGFKEAILANAFEINAIPYYWKKGKIEKW